ncbi:MAG: AAA family ATPase [Clostridia bacterium]|nr:AAA family ATPase [Clostridia bacterium]
MIIERLSIGHFGNLSDVTLTLGPRLNVIVGNNESGKSTVAAFIRYMLYGFGTQSTGGDMPEREKRVSWTASSAEGSMEFSLEDGRRFRIERETVATAQDGRVSYREDSRLVDLTDGSVARFRSLPGEEFFSVPEQVYLNTAFFDQFSASRVHEGEMTAAMENILFSGDERVSSQRALRALNEARSSLSHQSGVGGAIAELDAQSDAVRTRLSQAIRLNAQIHRTETELHKLSVKIAEAERERDRLEGIDRDYRNYLTICTFDRLHKDESAYAALAAEHEKLRRDNEKDGFLPNEDYLSALVTAERVTEISRQNYLRSAEKLRSVKSETALSPEAEELLVAIESAGGETAVETEYTAHHRSARLFRVLAWLFASLAVIPLSLGAFLIRPLVLSPGTALLVLAALTMGVLSVLFFRNRRRALRAIATLCRRFDAASGADLLCKLKSVAHSQRLLAERRESILRAEENADISLQNLETLRRELSALVSKWKGEHRLGAPDEVVAAISQEARAFLAEDRRLSGEVAEARGKVMALRAELEGVSEIAIRGLVSPEKREAMKRINYKVIQEGLTYYRGTYDSLQASYRALLDELDGYRREAKNPAELRMEFAAMEERTKVLRRRFRAYGIVSDAINSASDRLRAEISPRLSEYAGGLLSLASDGRYEKLEVSNRLAMSYDDRGTLRPLPGMSGGTSEIAYIALRLALVDMLYKEKPPLCFDESLAHQDDGRTESILRMLDGAGTAEGWQCLFFACHDREAAIAARVSEGANCITLERSTAP